VSTAELEADSLETSVLKAGIEKLAPGEREPAAQNSQYLQENSHNGAAVLAVARASRRLGASDTEIEETVFSLSQDSVEATPQVWSLYTPFMHAYSVLAYPGSSRPFGRNKVFTGTRIPGKLSEEVPAGHCLLA
jgi:hypothetical protein